jgi:hypothetical protein
MNHTHIQVLVHLPWSRLQIELENIPAFIVYSVSDLESSFQSCVHSAAQPSAAFHDLVENDWQFGIICIAASSVTQAIK